MARAASQTSAYLFLSEDQPHSLECWPRSVVLLSTPQKSRLPPAEEPDQHLDGITSENSNQGGQGNFNKRDLGVGIRADD